MKLVDILAAILIVFKNITAQQLGLSEGDKCEGGWICSTVDKCSGLGDLKVARPKICSFTSDAKPIMCCPPPLLTSSSKAKQKCEGYTLQECFDLIRFKQKIDIGNLPIPGLDQTSVVGGSRVRPRVHKHMALIGYGKELNSVEWLCGGSVVSHNFVLSAAHCAESPSREIARWIRVGDLDVSTFNDDARPETIRISQRIIHPGFKDPVMYNDIALFRLERPLVFNAWVGPACLVTEPVLLQTRATVTGWGRTDFAGDLSSHLLAVDVPLVNTNDCKQMMGNSRRIPNGINQDLMICAGEKEGGKDACSGDSGGPLVLNSTTSCLKTQIGIISFGRMCALPNSPGIYTRIYHYLPWIESIVWPTGLEE